ncbi:MAG: hypothetical protein J1E97_05725 [Muribaculaceae bacterium]|nr:hypothetical protein [Muribaculaceae bacterium]
MKNLKALFCAGIVALMATACTDQTSFDIKDVPGRAVIKGTVLYNQGTELVDGKFVYDYKPAAHLPVYITVQNADYDSSLKGITELTTVTDAQGNYSIEVPAPEKDVTVNIRTADFEGVHSFIDIKNGETYEKQEAVVYRGIATKSVRSHSIVFCDMECAVTSTKDEFVGFTEYAAVSGQIGRNAEYYVAPQPLYNETTGQLEGYRNATLYNVWQPAPNVDLILTITYDGVSTPVTYNATTNSNGEFTLQVPVQEFPTSFSYTVEALTCDGTFTHYEPVTKSFSNGDAAGTYTDYTPTTLRGWYEPLYTSNGTLSYPTSNVARSFRAKVLVFNATSDDLGESTYNPYAFVTSDRWLADLLESLQEEEE